MNNKKVLGIKIDNDTKEQILEKIAKFIKRPEGFFHIVSLNPENLVVAHENNAFKEVFERTQIRINDGVGIVVAACLLGIPGVNRTSGVDLMLELLKLANERRLRVVLIGGGPKIADEVVNCQKAKFPKVRFHAFSGIQNIKNPKKEEEAKVLSIVSHFKPHFLFAAFGSPDQELWLYKNREKFKGVVCMGVGQGFDVLSGKVKRVPLLLRKIGLEWLYRLITQPWRWKRQLRLIKFLWLVLRERLS
jgi:N-acetylglucosaminyldiphosphoundecaprenol N-acetyl-beta-D-mannosaminyltransferase